jgi:hypothetical protein
MNLVEVDVVGGQLAKARSTALRMYSGRAPPGRSDPSGLPNFVATMTSSRRAPSALASRRSLLP